MFNTVMAFDHEFEVKNLDTHEIASHTTENIQLRMSQIEVALLRSPNRVEALELEVENNHISRATNSDDESQTPGQYPCRYP